MKGKTLKKWGLFLLSAVLCATIVGCSPESVAPPDPDGSDEMRLVGDLSVHFENIQGGKMLVLSDGWSTKKGAFGIQIAYDDVDDVSDVLYAHYSKTEGENGQYTAIAHVTTPNGSVIAAMDTMIVSGTKLNVRRTITVEKVGEGDLGFTTYFPLENSADKTAEEFEWFCPSNYYGNDTYTFSGVGVKTGFSGDKSLVTADNMGAPILLAYDGKTGFSFMDKTQGMRETTADDLGVRISRVNIDERINMPGLGICNLEEDGAVHTQIFHAYPAYSYNYITAFPFNTQYRMLPVKENLTREVAFEVERSGEYATIEDAARDAWRKSYDYYAVTDKRYAATDVKDTLMRRVNKSYGVVNGMPQYMTNADHFEAESGFLYRNADLAWLLLAEGRRTMNEEYIQNALSVLDSQVAAGRLDENLIFKDIKQHYDRASSDALVSLIRAYSTELSFGVDHRDWLNYLMQRADAHLGSSNWMDMNFFTELAKLTKAEIFTKKAISLAESVMEGHRQFIFTGAITNPAGDPIIDRESGILALRGYIDLYELTGEIRWLQMAELSALFVESMHQVQPINMEPLDCTGTEKDITGFETMQGYIGNGRIMPYGLSYISGQTTSADIAGVLAAPDFYRLYKLTGDVHYFEFYDYLTYNTTLYVNMGDKVGLMDDVLHSAGEGFVNEYIGLASGDDSAVYRRGSMHDSDIAWLPFAILQNYERTYCILQEETGSKGKIVVGDDLDRAYDLSKNKYSIKMENCYIIDLNEFCDIEAVEGAAGSVQFSKDGKQFFTAEGNQTSGVRYVKIEGTSGTDAVTVIGLPMTYDELSEDATVIESGGGKDINAATDGSYATAYVPNVGSILQLAFDEGHEVYQIAVRFESASAYDFTVEVSSDGTHWTEYLSGGNPCTLYSLSNYVADVKYVRLVFNGGTMAAIQSIKVLGA